MAKVRGKYCIKDKYKQKTLTMQLVIDKYGFICSSDTADNFKKEIQEIEKCLVRLVWTQIL